MLAYGIRSTKFINYASTRSGTTIAEWTGVLEGEDRIMFVGFEVISQGKTMKRVRRKFWDDVSVRGGQYSAFMLVLTAIYALFQGPFQDMKYGLKFAQMRSIDGHSTETEK